MKKNKKKANKKNEGFTINKNLGSYANDPVFRKKAEKAKEFIDKHGFPEELLHKK